MHVDEGVKGSGLMAKVIPCSKFKHSQSRRYMWFGSNNGNKSLGFLGYLEQCYLHYVVKTCCAIYEGKDCLTKLWTLMHNSKLKVLVSWCNHMQMPYNGCAWYNNFVYSWARTRCNLSKGKTFHQVVQSKKTCAIFYMIIGVNCGIIYGLW